jgi:DNA repair protein RecO (recombination protein O)
MTSLRSEAFVLSRFPLTESSWVVCLLTREEGKVRAVAKGARRTKSSFRGALEPLNRIRTEVGFREGRELGNLVSADLEESALDLFGAWPAAGVLMAVVEVLERGLADHAVEEETFRLVDTVLKGLRAGAPPELAWIYFSAWFLRLHGVLGRPDRCTLCGERKRVAHFDAGAGGWVCGACLAGRPQQGVEVSPAALETLDAIFRTALPDLAAAPLEPQSAKTLKSMVYLALVAYLGRPLASEDGVIR